MEKIIVVKDIFENLSTAPTAYTEMIDQQKNIYLVHDVLSATECAQIIASCERVGFVDAGISLGDGYHIQDLSIRKNKRVVVDSIAFAEQLWSGLKSHISPVGDCVPVGVNSRFRIYKYGTSDYFRDHLDQSYYHSLNTYSLLSCVIYLNDGDGLAGGETGFGHMAVSPKTGTALIFDHYLTHSSLPVTAGHKYALRTDIMFQKRNTIPEIGYGTYELADAKKWVKCAIDTGYTYVDTAEIYENEHDVLSIVDDSAFVSTKIWTRDVSVEEFRKKLVSCPKTNLVLLHTADNAQLFWPELVAYNNMAQKFSHIGVSNFGIFDIEPLDPKPYCNQVELSPYNYSSQLVEYCQKYGIHVVAHSVTACGRIFVDSRILDICTRYDDVSPMNIVINWLVDKGVSVLIGSADSGHLADNLKYVDLDDADKEMLDGMNIGLCFY